VTDVPVSAPHAKTERRYRGLVPHLVLWLGIGLTAFPLWLALVASTHDNPTIAQVPMPLWPGPEGLANYRSALLAPPTACRRA
jgi:ABC-type glycerol-3-phosphate transport system permease component